LKCCNIYYTLEELMYFNNEKSTWKMSPNLLHSSSSQSRNVSLCFAFCTPLPEYFNLLSLCFKFVFPSFTYALWIISFMYQSVPWNFSHSLGQEINLLLLRNLKVHLPSSWKLLLDPILTCFYPGPISHSVSGRTILILSSHLLLCLPRALPLRFWVQKFHMHFILRLCT